MNAAVGTLMQHSNAHLLRTPAVAGTGTVAIATAVASKSQWLPPKAVPVQWMWGVQSALADGAMRPYITGEHQARTATEAFLAAAWLGDAVDTHDNVFAMIAVEVADQC